ncbi:MAG TPA: hypothetical protein VM491_07360 [Burkholderiaceae bacterium]|nr:hypothetical protein [Burkholderiaceae bacterium]
MSLHERYRLTRVINAAGSYTPLGVSRSAAPVASAAAEALSEFFVIDELQRAASDAIARATGAESAAVTHCAAAAITLSVAATMTGADPDAIARLPDASGLPRRVVMPAGHAVDYGHPIVQDVRLAGATPVPVGGDGPEPICELDALSAELAQQATACLLLVSSRLVRGRSPELTDAVAAAHRHGVPAIIDGAAQDLRIGELLATGADLVLVSAQKYLAAPTAGLAIGRQSLVDAVRAQEKGIGRSMKATKEALVGVLAALDERQRLDLAAWRHAQHDKVARFVARANALPGVVASITPDPAGMPFPRAELQIDPQRAGRDAAAVAAALAAGTPSIRVMTHALHESKLVLELVPLTGGEVGQVLARLSQIVAGSDGLIC